MTLKKRNLLRRIDSNWRDITELGERLKRLRISKILYIERLNRLTSETKTLEDQYKNLL